jgi:hypothetical protein
MEGRTILLIVAALAALGGIYYCQRQSAAWGSRRHQRFGRRIIRDAKGHELVIPGDGTISRASVGVGTSVRLERLLRPNRHQTGVFGGPNPKNAAAICNADGDVLTQTPGGLIWSGSKSGIGHVVIAELLPDKTYALRSGMRRAALAGGDGVVAVAFDAYSADDEFRATQKGWQIV